MFLLAVFLMVIFSVFWRIVIILCFNVDGEKLWQKT